jgi:regulatory protein
MTQTQDHARALALNLLDKQALSSHRVREKLLAKGFAAEVAQHTIDSLQRAGLLDDHALATELADRLLHKEASWKDWIAAKLLSRGISQEMKSRVIDEVFTTRNEQEYAARAARERLGRLPGNLSQEARARRIASYLARRGFSEESVTSALEGALTLETDH